MILGTVHGYGTVAVHDKQGLLLSEVFKPVVTTAVPVLDLRQEVEPLGPLGMGLRLQRQAITKLQAAYGRAGGSFGK